MSPDRAAELAAELDAAADGPSMLAALARGIWHNAHDGSACPADRIPAPAALAAWLPMFPAAVWAEVGAAELAAGAGAVCWVSSAGQAVAGAMNHAEAPAWFGNVTVAAHRQWAGLPAPRPRHPIAPLVACWQRDAPVDVEPETRTDRRIMPVLRVVGTSPERERGILFGGLVDDRPREVDLPLFPDLEPKRYRVPLLEIVDATGVPLRNRGKGAPLESRLLVRGGLLMIRPEDRGRTTVRIAVTVGEMLDGLYPGKRRISQNWPKVEAALRTARDFTVTDATGGRWFPMALRRLPAERRDGEPPALDDVVVIDLAPPPGAGSGATVDLPALDLMGVKSGPRWRAYIAGRSLIWTPGKTRRPAPRAAGRRYGWSADPSDYPVLTLADLRRLAFGDKDASNRRTRAAILAPWSDLPDVVLMPGQTDPRTGGRGYRLLPAEAAVARRKLGAE